MISSVQPSRKGLVYRIGGVCSRLQANTNTLSSARVCFIMGKCKQQESKNHHLITMTTWEKLKTGLAQKIGLTRMPLLLSVAPITEIDYTPSQQHFVTTFWFVKLDFYWWYCQIGDRSRPNIDRFSDRLTNIGFISEYHAHHVCLAGRGKKNVGHGLQRNLLCQHIAQLWILNKRSKGIQSYISKMTIFDIKCEYNNMRELSIITSKPLEALK